LSDERFLIPILNFFVKYRNVQKRWYAYGMKKPEFANLAVFIIFFGIALIEALQKQNWLEAALFLALGALSLRADFSAKK